MLYFYRIFSNFMFFPIFIYFLLRFVQSKESIESISQKFFLTKISRPKGEIIWINGVSIGEAKSGVLLINQILKINPKAQILLTPPPLSSYNLLKKKKN